MVAPSDRPDPDALLERVQQDEARLGRGRLRIYFGASAGVGKTFAMLVAARKAHEEGRDVLIGVVETHGRSETAELIDGFNILPRREIVHRDRMLSEFDLDGALARKPSLLLVDELAHSNVDGARHPKRWQDVEELLTVGIEVWTTLNVQHLESLNDVVGGITGIRVFETVPDTVFDTSDEVVLVDVPAEELLARLAAGKVYMPQHAERAAANFFRKGNLIALREIALRKTADRVESDVQTYRIEKSIDKLWKTEAALLACIGATPGAEHVVRSAARLAGQLSADWHAVYVETPTLQRLASPERERILRVLKLAEELGATTAVLTGNDVAVALVDYARTHNLSRALIGRAAAETRWPWRRNVGAAIGALAPEIDVLSMGVGADGPQARRMPTTAALADTYDARRSHKRRRYAWAVLAVTATTLVAATLHPYFDLANIVMLFLLAVVLVSARYGRGPAILAAVLGVAAFDFFFVPPRFTFAVGDFQYVLTFVIMLAVGVITAHLTSRLRYQARIAAHREARARELFEFARELSGALQTEQVVDTSVAVLSQAFSASVALLLPDATDHLRTDDTAASPVGADLGVAQWAFDHGEPAGLATDTLPANAFHYLPLRAPMRVRGVLAIKPRQPRWLLIPEQQRQLETYATLIAIALERVHYVEVAQDALVKMEGERLRNSLLAALSHDLRTPLTALVGLAETLAITKPPLSLAQAEIAAAMRDESLRMGTLVANLLDMARLESGEVRLRRDWQSIEEVVGSAVRASRHALGTRRVDVALPADLPLVEFDAVLIERVLANLLENAAKYTAAPTAIGIGATVGDGSITICVADRGPGLPKGREATLFDKFTRGHPESATPGVGLGLAICRAIVEAHHGRIEARNRDGGGAAFSFTLPRGVPPTDAMHAAEAASTGAVTNVGIPVGAA